MPDESEQQSTITHNAALCACVKGGQQQQALELYLYRSDMGGMMGGGGAWWRLRAWLAVRPWRPPCVARPPAALGAWFGALGVARMDLSARSGSFPRPLLPPGHTALPGLLLQLVGRGPRRMEELLECPIRITFSETKKLLNCS